MHYFTPKRCATTNKIMYHDKVKALQAAEDSRIERGTELWVYRCDFCGMWHLTHRNPQLNVARMSQKGSRKPYSRKKGYKPRYR